MKILIGLLVIVLLVGLGYVVYTSTLEPVEEVTSEESPSSKLSAADERTLLVGVWRSNEDAKFTREFRENGQVVDMYESVDMPLPTQGIWSIVTDVSAEPVELAADFTLRILKLEFPEETMYFGLSENTTTTLDLVYLGRGGMLTFTKVQ